MSRLALIGTIIAAMLLSGCAEQVDNDRLRVDIISPENHRFSVNQNPLPKASAYLRAATAQGLVSFDREGRVVPALASRWMVTGDQLSYVFRLNKTSWNNLLEVDAADVATQLNNRIGELKKGPMRRQLGNVIGVEKMTGRVLQIRLKAPMPNLLEYLAMPAFGIVHNSYGSGPMKANSQRNSMLLRLREEENDKELILSEKRLFLHANTANRALARLTSGESDMVTDGSFKNYPAVNALGDSDFAIDSDNMLGLFGLLLLQAGPFLSEQENREAITMAIDRPRMLTAFSGAQWRERRAIVPETLRDRGEVPEPAWSSMNMSERKAAAREIISKWENENGEVRPLRIAMSDSAGERMLFAWIKADLVAIGLDAERVDDPKRADFQLIDRLAISSSTTWYLDQLSCQQMQVCSEEADQLLDQALAARNLDERRRIFGEAESILQSERNFIPIANPLRWTAYREGLLGYAPNPRGWHYLQYLGRDPT